MIEGIERLRGVACILVVIHHIIWICPLRFIHEIIPKHLLNAGGGMRIFFAISGFVITLSLRDKIAAASGDLFLDRLIGMKTTLLTFYKKRICRIFPMVIFVVLLLGIFLNFTKDNLIWLPSLLRVPGEIFCGVYNNSVELFTETELVHTCGTGPFWTLAIEMTFYAFWPICLLLCRNDSARAKTALLLGSGMIFAVQPIFGAYDLSKYYLIHNNLGELFLGSFLAYLYQSPRQSSGCSAWAKALVCLLTILVWASPNLIAPCYYSNVVVGVSAVFLVSMGVFVPGSFNLPLLGPLLSYLGSHSFSIYAIHLFLAQVVVWFTNSAYFHRESFYEHEFYRWQFIIFVVSLLVFAEIVYRVIEKPCREIGRK
ncbi:MAG: acyltransferase [Holosporaceae bacterium]|jgi:peptidoglycan/LPS O-acetylase OafA/YrhL|nr:acyltransferase [Holosporaceae bacterium]